MHVAAEQVQHSRKDLGVFRKEDMRADVKMDVAKRKGPAESAGHGLLFQEIDLVDFRRLLQRTGRGQTAEPGAQDRHSHSTPPQWSALSRGLGEPHWDRKAMCRIIA